MLLGICRFAVAPSDAAEKNCNIGAQLQSLTCINVPEMFWKIYFIWLLVRTNLFIPSRFWTTYTNLWHWLSALGLYSDMWKQFLYRYTSTFSVLN